MTSSPLLVVDLELTCWEGETPPEGQSREIIEIGYSLVESGVITREASLLVRPVRSEVSAYCENLTSISAAMLEDAPILEDAVETWRAQLDVENLNVLPWASWGDSDRRAFERQGVHLGRHLNLSAAYSFLLGKRRRATGLKAATQSLGLTWEGEQHRALPDAHMTALVALRLRSLSLPNTAAALETLMSTLKAELAPAAQKALRVDATRALRTLADTWDAQAAELEARNDVIHDEHGALWADAGFQSQHGTLLQAAEDLRTVIRDLGGMKPERPGSSSP